jgi:hypothetical protein
MWTRVTWYLLLSVCSADPSAGCTETVIDGFMSRQTGEATVTKPLVDVVAEAKAQGRRWSISGRCVGIESREA